MFLSLYYILNTEAKKSEPKFAFHIYYHGHDHQVQQFPGQDQTVKGLGLIVLQIGSPAQPDRWCNTLSPAATPPFTYESFETAFLLSAKFLKFFFFIIKSF